MASDAAPQESGDLFCPKCGVQFQLKRKDQRFCDRACQKNAARGSQKAADNKDCARTLETRRHRGHLLHDMLLRKHPSDRPAFLDEIVTAARDRDWFLRTKLTDRRYLSPKAANGTSEGNRWAYLVQAIDQHCRQKWGPDARIFRVVEKGWTPPAKTPTGACQHTSSAQPEEPLPVYQKVDAREFFRMLREEVAPLRFKPRETRSTANREAWQSLMARSIAGDPVRELDSLLANREPEQPKGYDWRRMAKAMKDPGWQRYWRLKLTEDSATEEDPGMSLASAEQDAADLARLERCLP